jgi:hypothetical protein
MPGAVVKRVLILRVVSNNQVSTCRPSRRTNAMVFRLGEILGKPQGTWRPGSPAMPNCLPSRSNQVS